MEFISKTEKMFASWLKPIPNLPVNGQKWVAQNAWWIVLIDLIISIIGIFTTIAAIITFATFSSVINYGIYGYGSTITQSYVGPSVVSLIFSLLVIIASVVLAALAISPLKAMKLKGWRLLYLLFLISLVLNVVGDLISLNIIGLIFSLIGLGIFAYFLFQIRGYFGSTAKATHVAK